MKRKADPENDHQEGAQKRRDTEQEAAERLEAAQSLVLLKEPTSSTTGAMTLSRDTAEGLEAAQSLMLLKESTPTTAVAATPSRNTFSWNDLPAEIKNQIYGYALEDVNDLVICRPRRPVYMQRTPYCPFRSTRGKTEEHRAPNLSLLRVSKQIYTEARLFLYQGNTIRFQTLNDFHAWVHSKLPVAVYVKNSALWHDYHGTRVIWEISIRDGAGAYGLVLSPVVNADRARRLEETPSVVFDDFVDSVMRRTSHMTFHQLLVFALAPGMPVDTRDWQIYSASNRRVPEATGETVEIGVDLAGFWLKWPGLRFPIQSRI